jgi:long-chain acyl-CoA synthetase
VACRAQGLGEGLRVVRTRIDADGYLHLVGRRKEMIVLSGGKNVFPDEIEKVLGQSPLVHEVAVLEHERRLVGLFVPETRALRESDPASLSRRVRADLERLSQQLPPTSASPGPVALVSP